tara:strand:+ start:79 stop:330 length:252 start_codon:yes stop_codon:yes gene_type:complete
MPKYIYFCEECQTDFTIFHGVNDIQKTCIVCEKSSIKKMLTKPIYLKTKKDTSTGKITQKYIEENKEVLKNLKKEAKKDYDGT